MEKHYYLIWHKRTHTTNCRMRDQVGVVLADKNRPPFKRGTGLAMRNVDWWGENGMKNINTNRRDFPAWLTGILRESLK